MIRKAVIEDIDGIISVYDKVKLDRNRLDDYKYRAEIQKNGFLLGIDSRGDIENEIREVYEFVVAEEDKKIVGYLIADHRKEQKFYDDDYKTWFDLNIKDFYYHDPKGMTIALVAVDPDWSGKVPPRC